MMIFHVGKEKVFITHTIKHTFYEGFMIIRYGFVKCMFLNEKNIRSDGNLAHVTAVLLL